jgi:putative nucleotidyltransferase with HDIG domain
MPVLVLVSFAVAAPHVPVLVAAAAGFFGALVFQSRSLESAIQATGEELVPVLLATAFSGLLPFAGFWGHLWPTSVVLAVFGYAVGWLAMAVLEANANGVGARSFLLAVRWLGINFLFFCLVALGLAYLVRRHGDAGYFTLALATVALVEAFHPYKLLSDQRDVLFASLTMIAQAIDLKDAYTGKHVRYTSEVAVRIARRLGLSEGETTKIRIAGILHDIGKVGVSGKIIRKPSTLDLEEMAMMRKHPVIGAEIMQPVRLLADAAEIVRHHHEHFDGTGYPDGLKGEQIPIGCRIVLVADAFHAITSERSYRRARSKDEALKILRANAGKQFDPVVVTALESIAAFLSVVA